jgi:hypothetical protein
MQLQQLDRLTWIVGPTICTQIVPRDRLYELLKGSLIARLLALAQCSCHCEDIVQQLLKNEKMLMMLPGPRMADENRTQLYYRFKQHIQKKGPQELMNVVLIVSVVQVVKSSTIVGSRIALGGNGKGSGLVGRVQVLPNWVSKWAVMPYI